MKNNWYNRLFHPLNLEKFLQAERKADRDKEQAAFERLHSAIPSPVREPIYKEYPEPFVAPVKKKKKKKIRKTEESKKQEEEDTYTPTPIVPIFFPTSPSSYEPSSPVEAETPAFSPGGGSFGGAGASASWEEEPSHSEPSSEPSTSSEPEPSSEPSEPSSSESESSSSESSSSDSSSSDSSSS